MTTFLSKDRFIRCLARGEHDKEPTLRAFMVESTAVAEQARLAHELLPVATVALGRALTGGLLLAALTKAERNLNLQIAGDGPLGGVFVDAEPREGVRGYVTRNPETKLRLGGIRPSLGFALGTNGFVNVLRADPSGTYFRSSVKLRDGEIDDDLSEYLAVSDQVESAIALDVVLDDHDKVTRAGGVLIQALPGHQVSLEPLREALKTRKLYRLLRDKDDWSTLLMQELGLKVQVLAEEPVRFRCHCSEERVLAALAAAGIDELSDMIEKDGRAEIYCDFCRKQYEFDRAQLVALRDLALSVSPGRVDN
jgi:molecular chaperone Hsp33